MRIGNFKLEAGRSFIIAELSANHGHSIEIAKKTIQAAKRAGADAIKLQTYKPDTITLQSDKDEFLIKDTIWSGKNLYDLYSEAFTPYEWHEELFQFAKSINLEYLSSPFDEDAVDFLENLDVPAYKIASFEITHIPLIKYAASKQKPIIISTGIAEISDIQKAIDACLDVGNSQIILLKCTSSYPAKFEDSQLNQIKELKNKFNTKVGLSDHTLGYLVPMLSVACGAELIEKHFILDKSIGGPDSSFSLDESEFSEMVQMIRTAEAIVGKKSLKDNVITSSKKYFSRSIYVSRNVKKGDLVDNNNIKVIRPGLGLHPENYHKIQGYRFNQDIEFATPLSLDLLDGPESN